MTWKPGGRSRCPGSPARLLISGRRSASRRPATWRCAPSYRPAWRAGRRALRNGRQTDMRVPHPPALADVRLAAHLLPEAEPAPVSRTHELRTPALSHAEDGETVRQCQIANRVGRRDAGGWDAAKPGAALQVAPHVGLLRRLVGEGHVVH